MADGIPLFAQLEGVESSGTNVQLGGAPRAEYRTKYQHNGAAATYDASFRELPAKARRTRRELSILEQLLAQVPDPHTLLDIPCGGGRLSGPLRRRCSLLIEADVALEQLRHALKEDDTGARTAGFTADALHLPLKDGAVNGVVCARLSHHLPTADERDALLGELIRVAREFVIFSFTESRSLPSLSRRLRGRALNPCAMSLDDVGRLGGQYGLSVRDSGVVSPLGSRHRYALLTRAA